jgi:hypothetical protein
VGNRTAGSFQCTQRPHTEVAHASKSAARSATHFVCFYNTYTIQRSPCTIREISKEGRKLSHQVPIYFVSEALVGSKKYYLEMEKICYAIVMSARKLWHYFDDHRVRVLMNQSLNDIFGNRDCSDRIGNWAMELSEYVVDIEKRSVIKSQVLAHFIANWIEPSSYTKGIVIDTPWQVHYDRAWGTSRAGAAAI